MDWRKVISSLRNAAQEHGKSLRNPLTTIDAAAACAAAMSVEIDLANALEAGLDTPASKNGKHG